jgi:hypothetical protein
MMSPHRAMRGIADSLFPQPVRSDWVSTRGGPAIEPVRAR